MALCKRNTKDPLLRKFFDTYHLSLLSIPRANASVGDLYVRSNDRIGTPGSIIYFFEPVLELPPVSVGEQMSDVYGTFSNDVKFGVGLSLLENFFNAVSAPGIFHKIKAEYSLQHAHSFVFSFTCVERQSMDAGLFGSRLIRHRFNDEHAMVNPGNRYYVVSGLAQSPGITVSANTKDCNKIKLDAEVLKIAGGEVGIEIEQSHEGEITYTGDTKLVFGVELYELIYDEKRNKMKMLLPKEAVQVMAAQQGEQKLLRPAELGGPDEDAFFDLDDL